MARALPRPEPARPLSRQAREDHRAVCAGGTDRRRRAADRRQAVGAVGRQFYIENVTGAGGNTGMGQAARAAPDGYTILFVSSSYVVNPSLYPKVPYDPYKDFLPVTVAGDAPNILLVHPSVPAKTVAELIDLVKANPGKYSFASAGTGTTPHLSGELFRLSLGLDLVHVPFGGGGPAIQAIA